MTNKKRILWCSEASHLSTGYAVYSREVLMRLHKSDKYEIAELACYTSDDHPYVNSVPWKVYPVIPGQKSPAFEKYKNVEARDRTVQFGTLIFDEVALDFKPDFVCDIRDYWMCVYEHNSPFRKCFKWIIQPTVDAAPQQEQWIDVYCDADAVFTYQDWSGEVLKKQGGGKINYRGSASPAASSEFSPLTTNQRKQLKQRLGLGPDVNVIGTVMRNQRRKLYPHLFQAFRQYLDESKRKDVVLYCHVSYPDNSWDIPQLIKEYGLSSKVYLTYICNTCKYVHPTVFQDVGCVCPRCHNFSCSISSAQNGINSHQLNELYNMFDMYVQYSNCLLPGEQIKTLDGWKNIEDVTTLDLVWTHNGNWQPVVRTFEHENNNGVFNIKVHADYEELNATGEHPIYVVSKKHYKPQKRSFREWLGVHVQNSKPKIEFEWKDTKDIQVGDMIVEKIDTTVQDYNIDLYDEITHDYIIENGQYRHKKATVDHPVHIETDLEFCRWFGLYGADGTATVNANTGQISICSDNVEEENRELSWLVMSKFGNVNDYQYKDRNGFDTYCSNKVFAKYLKNTCGKLENKRWPDWVLYLPLDKQKEILIGYSMGDGHYLVDLDTTVFSTISPLLAEQIKVLLKRLGFTYNVRIVEREGNRKQAYRFEVNGNLQNGSGNTTRTSTRSLQYNGYYLHQVKSIEEIDYNGKVYNIEVQDDNSYCCKIGNIHNSEGFGMPQIEAAMAGVPVAATNYSAMSDIMEKINGYPIDVLTLDKEIETGCNRAIPDNNCMVKVWTEFFNLPTPVREGKRQEVRRRAEQTYNWDWTARKWMQVFDELDGGDWNKPYRIMPWAPYNIHSHLSNYEYAAWLITDVLCEPEKLNSYFHMRIVRDLNYGVAMEGLPGMYYNDMANLFYKIPHTPFNREVAYKKIVEICQKRNLWETVRYEKRGDGSLVSS